MKLAEKKLINSGRFVGDTISGGIGANLVKVNLTNKLLLRVASFTNWPVEVLKPRKEMTLYSY